MAARGACSVAPFDDSQPLPVESKLCRPTRRGTLGSHQVDASEAFLLFDMSGYSNLSFASKRELCAISHDFGSYTGRSTAHSGLMAGIPNPTRVDKELQY